jgi:hypothetical protein
MIISHQNRFIFLRVPKTASTSIEIALSKFCGPEDIITTVTFKNDSANKVDEYQGPQNIKRNFWELGFRDWYSILRGKGPLDYRHAHASHIRKLIGNKVWSQYFKFCFVRNPFERAISMYFWRTKNWQKKHSQEPLPEINEYILKIPETSLSSWSCYTINDQIAVDFVGHYEKLSQDMDTISQKIGIPHVELPHAKSSTRKDQRHYSEILSPNSRTHIERSCFREMEAFGYYWEIQ